MKYILCSGLILLSCLTNAQDLSGISHNLPAGAKSIVLAADVNTDGLKDLFLAGETLSDQFVNIYLNNGDSSFTNLGVSIPYLSDATACLADLNNDTYVDLLYSGLDDSFRYQFYIFINQQNNTFVELAHAIPGIRFGAIQCADMDHDGWQDIFISGYSESVNTARLYKNNGDETFSETAFTFEGLRSCGVAIADFDHNTFPDIIYTGLDQSLNVETHYYQNTGNMQFVEKSTILPAAQFGGVITCDVNNDGFTDIAIYGKDQSNNHIARFYQNNSGLSFTYFDEITGIREGKLKTSDYDNDGYTDVILTGIDGSDNYLTELYLNNSGSGFTLETDTITALGYSDALWFDFNNDHKNDLLICGTTLSESKTLLLSSNLGVANQIPDVITGLNSETSSDTVRLSWDKGIDAETATDGLTYDIYLHTESIDEINFKPASDLTTGDRYTIPQGIFSTNSLELSNLPEGKYWWTVQSVDAAFEGSPFAIADTFYITQPISLGKDTTICFADSITFLLSDVAGTMEWYRSTEPSVAFSLAKSVKIEIQEKDTIWVVVSKDYGDQVSDTVIVDMYDLPNVDLGEDLSVCYGSEISLNIGTSADSVNWFTSSGIYTDIDTNRFIHNFYDHDEISAKLWDVNGCASSDTVLLTLLPLPEIWLTNDTSLCLYDTLHLNIGTVNDSVNWYSLNDLTEILNSNQFEYIVNSQDVYKVECFNKNGCVNYDTIHINPRSLPIADAGIDKLICSGYDVTIGPESALDGCSYFWESNGEISDQTVTNPMVHPTTDTRYYLSLTDNYGCVGNDSMLVKINPVGVLDAGADQEICIGESISIGGEPTAEGSILPYTYQWSPVETLQLPNSANPVAYPRETTSYSLIVFTGNCPVDTLETTVIVNPLPEIGIMNDTIAGYKEDIILYASGGLEYEWLPAEFLDDPYAQNPVANLDRTTHFSVKVTNEYGCSDTSGVNIIIKNEVFIPELFTPNDDGINDNFKVYGFGIKELNLWIYDERGVIVFESNNLDEIINNGWNGENNGHRVKEGKYFWKIDGEYHSGEKILFNGRNTGIITILR